MRGADNAGNADGHWKTTRFQIESTTGTSMELKPPYDILTSFKPSSNTLPGDSISFNIILL